jgi:hypothetical protein
MSAGWILGTVGCAVLVAGLVLGYASATVVMMDPWAPALVAAGLALLGGLWMGTPSKPTK